MTALIFIAFGKGSVQKWNEVIEDVDERHGADLFLQENSTKLQPHVRKMND